MRALLNAVPGEKKVAIQTIMTDLRKAYISGVVELFPSATLIHDRFNLVQYLDKAIDRARRREVTQYDEPKHSRYALLKKEETRTVSQFFQAIQNANLRDSVVWRLQEEFKAIFRCKSDANQYFKLRLGSVKDVVVKELMEIAERFERHREASVIHFAMNSPKPELSESMARLRNSKPSEEGQNIQKLPKRNSIFPWKFRPLPTTFAVESPYLISVMRPLA